MDHLASWIDHAADTPRHISMTSSKNDPHVQALFNAMKSNVGADNVRTLNAKRDTREPEFIIYDSPQTVLTGKHFYYLFVDFFFFAGNQLFTWKYIGKSATFGKCTGF